MKSCFFFETIDDCVQHQEPNAILLSSVLQYIEEPFKLMRSIIDKKFNYVLIDRTSFLLEGKTRLTVQKVPPKIYKASYPCWFFNESELLDQFKDKYEMIVSFNSLDQANIKSIYKGYLFKLKSGVST